MPRLTVKELEKHMQAEHVRACYLLVENDFKPKAEQKTTQEIADELGVSRTTLYKWRNRDDVIKLQGLLSERQMDTYRSKVDRALLRLIDDGSDRLPSVKAIELFYKLKGLMIDRSVVGSTEEDVSPRITQAELDAELEELNKMLED